VFVFAVGHERVRSRFGRRRRDRELEFLTSADVFDLRTLQFNHTQLLYERARTTDVPTNENNRLQNDPTNFLKFVSRLTSDVGVSLYDSRPSFNKKNLFFQFFRPNRLVPPPCKFRTDQRTDERVGTKREKTTNSIHRGVFLLLFFSVVN
jgi:hypothetical protein